jgi:chromosome segregation ATPase
MPVKMLRKPTATQTYYQMIDELDRLLGELEAIHESDPGYEIGSEQHSQLTEEIASKNGQINDAITTLGNFRRQHPGLESGEPAARRAKMQEHKDRVDYGSLLRNLAGSLQLVERIEEISRQHEDSPAVQQEYRKSRKNLDQQIDDLRHKLDALESRNPSMAGSPSGRRRAELERAYK